MTVPLPTQAAVFYGQKLPTQRRSGHRADRRFRNGLRHPDGGGGAAWSTGMMTGGDSRAVAGGEPVADSIARHIPVPARRAIDWLGVHDGGLYIDATFGAGGYTRLILDTPGP